MLAVYAGSFDPFTNGHLEVVRQAANVFERVIVLIADNPGKKHWFTQAERVEVAGESVGDLAAVEALSLGVATVDFAFRRHACLVRGLGEFTDYPAEKTLLGINSRLRPEVETVFLMTKEVHNQVRSSSVREVIKYPYGWRSVRDALPKPSFNSVLLKMIKARDSRLERVFACGDLSRFQHRPYHNLEHLVYMLDKADEWRKGEGDAVAIWYAILFHDMLVDSDADITPGEEIEKSIEELRAHAERHGLPDCAVEDVERLILATEHKDGTFDANAVLTPEEKLVRDIDLSVLGESPYEYARYAKAIREEYGPRYGYMSVAFKEGRKVFLTKLLARLNAGALVNPDIDSQMRINLQWELDQLAGGK